MIISNTTEMAHLKKIKLHTFRRGLVPPSSAQP